MKSKLILLAIIIGTTLSLSNVSFAMVKTPRYYQPTKKTMPNKIERPTPFTTASA